MSETYWLERALVGTGVVEDGVLVTVEGGRFADVRGGVAAAPPGAQRLGGLTVPGLANCHSHAFHRALRGRVQRGRGSFWMWREQMYQLAERLQPDTYFELARAVYREMAATGYTSVGEFHYVHHGPDGVPYGDANTMGKAIVAAAADAGLRIALLDACYLASAIGEPPTGVQERFSDGDADRWAERADDLLSLVGDDVVVGAAVHSVRAVPADQVPVVAAWAQDRDVPLHVHVSEQTAENDACLAAHGVTPTRLLAEAGALGRRTSVVHATHLTDDDVADLARSGAYACFCPTTERDLGDGIGPARRLADTGVPLTLGTDSHAVVDAFEELRALELDERLASQRRGLFTARELLTAGTSAGHESLGFADTGRIAKGQRADLVTVDTRSVRTAGTGGDVETAVYAAGAADVVHVVRDGRVVATAAERAEVGRELDDVISRIWRDL